MTVLLDQAIDSILTHTIAVIEGTGSNAGIPGVHSNDEALRGTVPSALTFNCTGATGTTVVEYTSGSYGATRWVRTRAPGHWLLCTAATNGANVGAARKISAWSQATTEFTCAAFPAAITADDTFYLMEGFRAVTDDNEAEAGEDRRFVVSIEPGEPIDQYGAGQRTVTGDLLVTLALASAEKKTTARRSAVANAEILRSALLDRSNWESTYTRALLPEGSEIDIDEGDNGIAVEIKLPIVYRFNLILE